MTRGNYRANGKRAKWDWTPEEDKALQGVRVKTWKERYKRGPSCFAEVAAKYSRTIRACSTRYYFLKGKIGPTKEGLWSPEEDDLIRDEIPLTGRVFPGTWVELAEVLEDRTVSAIRHRACILRKKLSV